MTVPDDHHRLKLPSTISMTAVITALGAIVGLVTTWNHFENKATNNADDISTLKTNTMLLRNELRALERNYDRQISHLDAIIATMSKDYTPIPRPPVPEDK